MSLSILASIKNMLGPENTDTAFDTDIIININSAFMILQQLGVGPPEGFSISNTTKTWADYLGADEALLEGVKSYIYLKLKLLFDPPTSSAVLQAIKEQIADFEWRLNVQAETITAADVT
jgi:hypothetical protein